VTPTPDPTPSPTTEEIAEQGVDESVSRFIGRLHEQIRTLTAQRDRYAAVVEAAKELIGEYSQQSLHVRRDPKPGASPSVCNWCGFSWPCPTSTLRDALAALEQNDE
jgi:hypothetical protein